MRLRLQPEPPRDHSVLHSLGQQSHQQARRMARRNRVARPWLPRRQRMQNELSDIVGGQAVGACIIPRILLIGSR